MSSNVSPDDANKHFNIAEIQKVLNSIANEDAMKIFLAAKEGIEKSTATMEELGLTQRRYYLRLNELLDAGLIEKRGDHYQLTTLGRICYNMAEFINTTLHNRDRLDLVDRLRKANSISAVETKEILDAISGNGLIGSLGLNDIFQPIKMIENYEKLVSELISIIDEAEKNIYLASYYNDSRVMEAIMRAIQRGLKFSLLTWSDNLSEKLQKIRMILTPAIAKDLLDLMTNEEVRIRNVNIPYSFCIIDEKFAIFELPNPSSKTFYVGFSLQNEAICQRLKKTFEELYSVGKEDATVSLLRKFRGVAASVM